MSDLVASSGKNTVQVMTFNLLGVFFAFTCCHLADAFIQSDSEKKGTVEVIVHRETSIAARDNVFVQECFLKTLKTAVANWELP